VIVALWLFVALAGTPAEDAESARLADEVVRLAQKGAWSGVERAYAQMRALPSPIEARIHVLGAEAALAGGDVGGCLARWELAYALDPDPSYVERYTALRDSHAEVYLEGKGVSLVPAQASFLPQAQAAVGFAAHAIAESGRFHGWLPPGDYVFGGRLLALEAGQRVRVVLPSARGRRKLGDVLGVGPSPTE
jgi:hypothetical protein